MDTIRSVVLPIRREYRFTASPGSDVKGFTTGILTLLKAARHRQPSYKLKGYGYLAVLV